LGVDSPALFPLREHSYFKKGTGLEESRDSYLKKGEWARGIQRRFTVIFIKSSSRD